MKLHPLAVVSGLLAGCCPAPPASTASALAGAAPSAAAVDSFPAVDIDADDCATLVRGRLFGKGGALWFEPEAEPLPDDEPWDPSSWDRRAGLGWQHGPTLVTSARGTWGLVVPTADGTRGWVVRQDRVRAVNPDELELDRRPEPDALGLLAARDAAFQPVWAPGEELLLLGRVGNAAVVLARSGRDRLVAVAEDGAVVAESMPVDGTWSAGLRPVMPNLGLPFVAPFGPAALAFRCSETELCLARVGAGAIVLERHALAADHVALVAGALAVVRRGAEGGFECLLPGQEPPATWASLPWAACPEDDDVLYPADDELGLPADGVLARGFAGEVERCRVRDRVALPLRDDPVASPAAEQAYFDPPAGAGIVVLNDVDWRQGRLRLELLVRGAEVAVGFAFLDGAGAPTVRRDFGVALPPGTVEARPAVVGGRALYRVDIDVPLPFPFLCDGDCWLGRLVVRATWSPEWGDEQAFANRYWEFGVCE